MSKKLLFNLNKNVSQDYTYVKYTGTIIIATNTLEKPIKNAILKGCTYYRDTDTNEILETFEEGRNLELVSVKMPVLQTYDGNIMRLSPPQHTTNGATIEKINDVEFLFNQGSRHGMGGWKWNIPNGEAFTLSFYYEKVSGCENQCQVSVACAGGIADKTDLSEPFGQFEKTYYVRRTTPTVVEFKPVGELTSTKSVLKISNLKWYIGNKVYSDKSNILRVSNDLTLRSKGTTFDELNILTGKLTQRIDEDGEILNEEIISFVELTITDQDDNIINQINSFDNTTHIITSSDTIPPTFEGYIATKESDGE